MTAENAVILPVITRLDTDPVRVLNAASEEGLTGVVVLGYDSEGEEYFASSYADGGNVLWLLERLKKRLLQIPDGLTET